VLLSGLLSRLERIAELYHTVNLRLERSEAEIHRLQDDMRVMQRDITDLRAHMASLDERLNTARAELRAEFAQLVAEMQIAYVRSQAAQPALPPESTHD
jgi:division protein CdvB (Snf7/Vps24/ESCRT-III family)